MEHILMMPDAPPPRGTWIQYDAGILFGDPSYAGKLALVRPIAVAYDPYYTYRDEKIWVTSFMTDPHYLLRGMAISSLLCVY